MRRAVLTLLAGGALAQALPLLLGPWLARLYSPAEFGVYHLFAAVAANAAVVACARYEFALPLAADEAEATALRTLCRRVLVASTAMAALAGLAWALAAGRWWPLWLPAAVGALGLVSLATLNATRAQRFQRLALARVLQHGGGALAQAGAGVLQAGVAGLIAAPIAAALAAVAALGWPGPARAARSQWQAVARVHRSFPLLNTPHAFLAALQDTLAVALVAASLGPAAAGAWGLALRYLKAPATWVGGAVSQVLYPRLAATAAGGGDAAAGAADAGWAAGAVVSGCTAAGRALVRQSLLLLALPAVVLTAVLWALAPPLFTWAFGAAWAEAGALAQALALYTGLHFVASPLGVVTMAWRAQAWALRLAAVGQALFVAALAAGLAWGGLVAAGWAVSAAMLLYFGWYFYSLATWPLDAAAAAPAAAQGGAA
jgi:O-antigen/teichoic acid export membrane protein